MKPSGMVFKETELKGAFVIGLERREDERGFFARAFCQREFKAHGLKSEFVQTNLSHNRLKGTLRGMHFQLSPYEEAKVIRAVRGALYDVIIDLRPESPTYLKWIGVELSAANGLMLYVPERFAHGFITLEDETDAYYLVTQFHQPNSEGGIRYNDGRIGIRWPAEVKVISDKDKKIPDFKPELR